MSRSSRVDGNNLMYHYLQKSLQEEDSELFQQIVSRLINRLGIWFPPEIYRILPIALPHVVRDPSCRGNGGNDEWSSPNKQGYVRDDNTLVKSLVRSFYIRSSTFSQYHNKRLGRGFVAAHVWSKTKDDEYTTRIAITNSFLPNFAWLPSNVAKLTDRRDSFAEKYMQALSIKIYRHIDVYNELQPFVNEAWDLLPKVSCENLELPELNELNFFQVPERFISNRLRAIQTARKGLECVEHSRPLHSKKILHKRYTLGLPKVSQDHAQQLGEHLEAYAKGVEAALADSTA